MYGSYYAYWEEQIFGALNRMVLSSLNTCLGLIKPKEELPGMRRSGSSPRLTCCAVARARD